MEDMKSQDKAGRPAECVECLYAGIGFAQKQLISQRRPLCISLSWKEATPVAVDLTIQILASPSLHPQFFVIFYYHSNLMYFLWVIVLIGKPQKLSNNLVNSSQLFVGHWQGYSKRPWVYWWWNPVIPHAEHAHKPSECPSSMTDNWCFQSKHKSVSTAAMNVVWNNVWMSTKTTYSKNTEKE